MSALLKQSTLDLLDMMGGYFAADLDRLSDEQAMTSPGGAARRPIDYAHEVRTCEPGHRMSAAQRGPKRSFRRGSER